MTQSRLLHLLRHGAPCQPGLLLGHSDSPATPEGIASCVDRAAGLTIGAIVASDLRRASVAAERIAAERDLTLRRDPRWRELDFGIWDGCAVAEVDADHFARFLQDPDAAPPPGGERWSSLVARIGAAIADLPAEDILVVTHGGAMRATLAVLCGFALPQLWAFDLPYNALVTLRLWSGAQPTGQIVGLTT